MAKVKTICPDCQTWWKSSLKDLQDSWVIKKGVAMLACHDCNEKRKSVIEDRCPIGDELPSTKLGPYEKIVHPKAQTGISHNGLCLRQRYKKGHTDGG